MENLFYFSLFGSGIAFAILSFVLIVLYFVADYNENGYFHHINGNHHPNAHHFGKKDWNVSTGRHGGSHHDNEGHIKNFDIHKHPYINHGIHDARTITSSISPVPNPYKRPYKESGCKTCSG